MTKFRNVPIYYALITSGGGVAGERPRSKLCKVYQHSEDGKQFKAELLDPRTGQARSQLRKYFMSFQQTTWPSLPDLKEVRTAKRALRKLPRDGYGSEPWATTQRHCETVMSSTNDTGLIPGGPASVALHYHTEMVGFKPDPLQSTWPPPRHQAPWRYCAMLDKHVENLRRVALDSAGNRNAYLMAYDYRHSILVEFDHDTLSLTRNSVPTPPARSQRYVNHRNNPEDFGL